MYLPRDGVIKILYSRNPLTKNMKSSQVSNLSPLKYERFRNCSWENSRKLTISRILTWRIPLWREGYRQYPVQHLLFSLKSIVRTNCIWSWVSSAKVAIYIIESHEASKVILLTSRQIVSHLQSIYLLTNYVFEQNLFM